MDKREAVNYWHGSPVTVMVPRVASVTGPIAFTEPVVSEALAMFLVGQFAAQPPWAFERSKFAAHFSINEMLATSFGQFIGLSAEFAFVGQAHTAIFEGAIALWLFLDP